MGAFESSGAIGAWPVSQKETREQLLQAVKRALPMALGYAPVGFAFAAMALAAGMPKGLVLLMSAMVYACSSQVVALQLLMINATWASIMVTTFVVNLRHVLMSTALAPHLRAFKKNQLAMFSFQLCDEAFALHSEHWRTKPATRSEAFCVNLTLYAAWLLGNVAAVLSGVEVHHMTAYGLDFAPHAMFVGLLAMLLKTRLQVGVAVCCGALAVALRMAGWGAWSIVVASLFGASLGLGVELWKQRSKKFS